MRAVIASFIAVFLASIPSAVSSGTIPESTREVGCIAKAMYHEARAESVEGIKAVGYVILNRTETVGFPTSPCGVLYQKNQFSQIKSKKISDWKTYNKVYKIAESVYTLPNDDNTAGATYFHNIHVHPKWSRRMTVTAKYGAHVFLKPRSHV